jgi:hypothetical protein
MTPRGRTPDRTRLLAALAARQAGEPPLTATQQGIWLAEQLDQGTSGYHDTAGLAISGPLDAGALRDALADAQAEHEALRCRITDRDGQPRQRFDVDTVDWNAVDLTGVSPAARPARLERLVAATAASPFDLARGPLWRARLIRTGAEEHVLVLVLHHLIIDGWSHGLLMDSLISGYAARIGGQPPARPRSGYASWLNGRTRREAAVSADGTARALAAELGPLPYRLRLAGLDPSEPDRRAAELPVSLPPPAWAAFDTACRKAGRTRFMALTGLFALALCRAGGQDGALFATPIAGRYGGTAAGLMGCMINLVPIRVPVRPDDRTDAAQAAGTRALARAMAHPDLPYREIARAAGPLPAGDDPLTNVGLEQFNAPASEVRAGPLRVTPLSRAQVRLRHDLTLSVPRAGDGPPALLYPSARWHPGDVADLAGDLAELVTAVSAAPVS